MAVCAGATGTAGTGARLGSITVTLPLAAVESPAGSRAVTVTVALPAAAAVMVRLVPDSETLATPAFDEIAVRVRASPSGSLKTPPTLTVTDSPAVMFWAGIDPDATGGRLGCGAGSGSVVPPSPPQAAAQVTASSASGRTRRPRSTPDGWTPESDSIPEPVITDIPVCVEWLVVPICGRRGRSV